MKILWIYFLISIKNSASPIVILSGPQFETQQQCVAYAQKLAPAPQVAVGCLAVGVPQ